MNLHERIHRLRRPLRVLFKMWHRYPMATISRKLIQIRSGRVLQFHVTSLYPLLYRLEERGWIVGKWVEKPEQRRRRYYSLTAEGRKTLPSQRRSWREFAAAIGRVTGVENA